MQTFLPYASFSLSAAALDNERLNHQRLNARRVFDACMGGGTFGNHPCVQMWKHHVEALAWYHNCILSEWCGRGFANEMAFLVHEYYPPMPSWFGDQRLHSSHRSNLLRKDPLHYGKYGWTDVPNQDYFWPTKQTPNVH